MGLKLDGPHSFSGNFDIAVEPIATEQHLQAELFSAHERFSGLPMADTSITLCVYFLG
jgi:hypothetical protein